MITDKAIVRLFKAGFSVLGIMKAKKLDQWRVEGAIRKYLYKDRK